MEESVGEEEARRLEIENQVVRIYLHVLGFYPGLMSGCHTAREGGYPPGSAPPPYHFREFYV